MISSKLISTITDEILLVSDNDINSRSGVFTVIGDPDGATSGICITAFPLHPIPLFLLHLIVTVVLGDIVLDGDISSCDSSSSSSIISLLVLGLFSCIITDLDGASGPSANTSILDLVLVVVPDIVTVLETDEDILCVVDVVLLGVFVDVGVAVLVELNVTEFVDDKDIPSTETLLEEDVVLEGDTVDEGLTEFEGENDFVGSVVGIAVDVGVIVLVSVPDIEGDIVDEGVIVAVADVVNKTVRVWDK